MNASRGTVVIPLESDSPVHPAFGDLFEKVHESFADGYKGRDARFWCTRTDDGRMILGYTTEKLVQIVEQTTGVETKSWKLLLLCRRMRVPPSHGS